MDYKVIYSPDAISDLAEVVGFAAIITKEEDFAERYLYSQDQPVIVWLRIGNTSNQALLSWFVPLWPEIIRRNFRDASVLPRRLALFYFQASAEKILQTPLNAGRPRFPPR
jgi:hypothetical protein